MFFYLHDHWLRLRSVLAQSGVGRFHVDVWVEQRAANHSLKQPTWQNTCLKLVPIDHHERGKIVGHAGIHFEVNKPLQWDNTKHKSNWGDWLEVCIQHRAVSVIALAQLFPVGLILKGDSWWIQKVDDSFGEKSNYYLRYEIILSTIMASFSSPLPNINV